MADTTTEPKTDRTSTRDDAIQRAAIDKSVRQPVYFFITSGASWLFISTILGLLASIRLYAPDFLDCDGMGWMSYAKVQPAFIHALVYGWGFQAGLGVMVWLMARLCRVELRNPLTLVVAGHFWNLGVIIGVLGILFGFGHPMELFGFPSFVWPILLVAYVLVTIWLVIMFKARRDGPVFISQWYILGACFWFPWALGTAYVLLHCIGGGGAMGAGVNAWCLSCVLLLFFVPVGLAAAYYMIPKVVGRPIYSYGLATVGFWSLAALAGWAGLQKYMGGPFPAWMTTVGSVALILMIIPVAAVALNHHMTVRGSHTLIQYSPTLRFTFFGALMYTLTSGASALLGNMSTGALAQFSLAWQGTQLFTVYAFFSMCMFGAIYFIVPRLAGCEWVSGRLIRIHFWASAYGVIALVILPIVGGLFQGVESARVDAGWYGVSESIKPYAIGLTIAWTFIAIANLSFLFHLTLMIFRLGRRSPNPTLIHELPAEGASASAHA